MTSDDTLQRRVSQEIDRIKASNLLGRSGPLHKLLDYLGSRAGSQDVPKEFEIAHAVFDKDGAFDVGNDATIRVYVHRLRKKLEEFYARHPGSERLTIPRGTYRLVLATEPVAADPDREEPAAKATAPAPPPRQGKAAPIIAALVAVATLLVLGGVELGQWRVAARAYPKALARTALWEPFPSSSLRSYFVVGDRSLPPLAGTFLSPGSMKAVLALMPVANALVAPELGTPPVTTMSRMSPYMVKEANLIYVGTLSEMGLIRDVVVEASGFAIDERSDALVDRASGRRFMPQVVTADHLTVQSYGYLASLNGPSHNRIIVISGTGDAPLVQMAEIASDPQQIDRLVAKAGPSFEALYAVNMLKDVNIGHRLLLVRPLPSSRP